MLGFLFRGTRRKQLSAIVKVLPHVLAQGYGSAETYTVGQVRASAGLLGIRNKYLPFALALMCTESDYLSADPQNSSRDYSEKRDVLAKRFKLDERDLNGMKLVSIFGAKNAYSQHPAQDSLTGIAPHHD